MIFLKKIIQGLNSANLEMRQNKVSRKGQGGVKKMGHEHNIHLNTELMI